MIQSDLTHINPTLYLCGYRLVSVTTAEGFSGFAVVRGRVDSGQVLLATHLDKNLVVEVRHDEN